MILLTEKYKKVLLDSRGTALVTLLIFMIIAITVTSAGASIILVNSQSGNTLQQGVITPLNAEAGIENAMVRLLRDPNYSGETLTVSGAQVVVTVTGMTTKTITSVATAGNFKRTIEVVASYTNNILTVTSTREIF